MQFLNKFRRITYSTSYLPEIDGLRFLAIFSVVVIMHTTHYIDDRLFSNQLVPAGYWKNFVMQGGNGVPLFFVISGFILSLPFARWRLNKAKKIPLSYYYLRRLTRLEPPYLIALLIFFIAHVWILGNYSFQQLLPHFLASAAYLHQPIYENNSLVLPIAWSLEVEVQFYIIAPLICLIFLIRSRMVRSAILVTAIISSALYWFDIWGVVHLFVYLHYFLTGILVADMYCNETKLIKNHKTGMVVGLLSLAGFIFIPTIHYLPGYLAKILCMFLLLHLVLSNMAMKKLFSVNVLVIIGGMCYSIYLLHYAIISAIGYFMLRSGITVSGVEEAVLTGIVMVSIITILSSVYFLLVEKPFMRTRGLKWLSKN